MWTKDMDMILRESVLRFGEGAWGRVAPSIESDCGSVTPRECEKRWTQVRDTPVKGPWSFEEDCHLRVLVGRHGPKKWTVLAMEFPGRTGKQCRERWYNHVDDRVNKTNWTREEDRRLCEFQRRLGNKWSEMSRILNGRSENSIKNRFNSLCARGLTELSQASQVSPLSSPGPNPSNPNSEANTLVHSKEGLPHRQHPSPNPQNHAVGHAWSYSLQTLLAAGTARDHSPYPPPSPQQGWGQEGSLRVRKVGHGSVSRGRGNLSVLPTRGIANGTDGDGGRDWDRGVEQQWEWNGHGHGREIERVSLEEISLEGTDDDWAGEEEGGEGGRHIKEREYPRRWNGMKARQMKGGGLSERQVSHQQVPHHHSIEGGISVLAMAALLLDPHMNPDPRVMDHIPTPKPEEPSNEERDVEDDRGDEGDEGINTHSKDLFIQQGYTYHQGYPYQGYPYQHECYNPRHSTASTNADPSSMTTVNTSIKSTINSGNWRTRSIGGCDWNPNDSSDGSGGNAVAAGDSGGAARGLTRGLGLGSRPPSRRQLGWYVGPGGAERLGLGAVPGPWRAYWQGRDNFHQRSQRSATRDKRFKREDQASVA